jgi:hypothetical protein
MAEPRFLLDGMLGSLARWLRIMGYDALYVRDASDADMLARLVGNDRTLLPRDRQLADRAGGRGLYLEEGAGGAPIGGAPPGHDPGPPGRGGGGCTLRWGSWRGSS